MTSVKILKSIEPTYQETLVINQEVAWIQTVLYISFYQAYSQRRLEVGKTKIENQ